jgi:hypothetical protein
MLQVFKNLLDLTNKQIHDYLYAFDPFSFVPQKKTIFAVLVLSQKVMPFYYESERRINAYKNNNI